MRPSSIPSADATHTPARTGGEDVARAVHLDAVGQAGRIPRLDREIEQRRARAERAVRPQRVAHHDRPVGVGLGDVEVPLLRVEGDAVGVLQLVGHQHGFARPGPDQVHAAEVEFARGVVVAPVQAVGGIREVQVARRVQHKVVRRVQALAAVGIGHRDLAAAVLQPGHAPVPVLAGQQPALAIERQSVRSGLLAVVGDARIARGLHPGARPAARAPLQDGVARDVGEQQVPAARDPDRAFRPGETDLQKLDSRVGGDQPVERGVQPLDAADGLEIGHERPF